MASQLGKIEESKNSLIPSPSANDRRSAVDERVQSAAELGFVTIEISHDEIAHPLPRAIIKLNLTAGQRCLLVCKEHAPLMCAYDWEMPDLNRRNPQGWTRLAEAAAAGDLSSVQKLLEYGKLDVNAKGPSGITALAVAAQAGRVDITTALLNDSRIDITAKSNSGTTLLMFAAGKWHLEILEILIEKKASLEEKNKEGRTALQFAPYITAKSKEELERQAETVRMLIDAGADATVKEGNGKTLLMSAAFKLNPLAIDVLLAKSDIHAETDDGFTALHAVASAMARSEEEKKWQILAADLLLRAGADIDAKTAEGGTPLMIAKQQGADHLVEALLAELGVRARQSAETSS